MWCYLLPFLFLTSKSLAGGHLVPPTERKRSKRKFWFSRFLGFGLERK
jgi:hypothetical protein